MVNLSLITACIPSMKQLLASFQTGLTGITIGGQVYEIGDEPVYEMGAFNSSQKNAMANPSSMNRHSAYRGDINPTGGNQSEASAKHQSRQSRKGSIIGSRVGLRRKDVNEQAESEKGLTEDAIMQSVDFRVEYATAPGAITSNG